MFTCSFRLKASDGHIVSPDIVLKEDGSVIGFNDRNEIGWEMTGDVLSFHFKTPTGNSLFARFDQVWEVRPGEVVRTGQFHFAEQKPKMAILIPNSGRLKSDSRRCHICADLRGRSTTLLITFNGTGNLAAGNDTRWEFYNLPLMADVDYIRIAEAPPVHWYLDQTKLVTAALAGIIAESYDKVFLCGISSGGFASMYFAEVLAKRFPEVAFIAHAINPQTVHASTHRRHVASKFSTDVRPEIISEDLFDNRDCATSELDEIIACNSENGLINAHHHVYYDSKNACEQFYSGLLSSFSRVSLHPQPLGLSHGDGCESIFKTNIVQHAILRETLS